MKSLFCTIVFASCALISFAQCPSPVVEEWNYDEAQDVFLVNVSGSPEAEYYVLKVFLQYAEFFQPQPSLVFADTVAVTGSAQIIEIDADSLTNGFGPSFPNALWYYGVQISSGCANGDVSEISPFYISGISMQNDPAINCNGNFLSPIASLPDGSGIDSEFEISIPQGSEVIQDLEVFIDLGHTYLGDLSIKLVSPAGTEINLLSFPNGIGARRNMSVIFRDGGAAIQALIVPPFNYVQGIAAPSQSLATFAGQPSEGAWTIRIRDNVADDEGYLYGLCLSVNGSPCQAAVSGKVFYDLNGNGILDIADQAMPYPWLLNTAENDLFIGNADGNYVDCTLPEASTIALQNTPSYYTSSPASFNPNQWESVTGLDLALTPIPGFADLAIDWFTIGPIRPGFQSTFIAEITNVGTECVEESILSFELPGFAEVVGSMPGGAIAGSSSGQLPIPALCPLEQFSYSIDILVDDAVSIGTLFTSPIDIDLTASDANPLNNSSSFQGVVVAAYDPNDKQVSSELINLAFVQGDELLKYTVRFQNTGNILAERVLIIDTLDANLDLTTFQLISTSHDVNITFEEHIAFFEFDQIFLPDSASDFEGSIGYVRYAIQPQANFGVNMEIENTAYIYFDFNAPIITNTVVTGFDEALGLNDRLFDSNLFPNPTSTSVQISWNPEAAVSSIELFDLNGKAVLKRPVGKGLRNVEIDVTYLNQGIYIVKLNSALGVVTKKLSIVR